MPRDRDGDSASSAGGGQSARPALDHHRRSDSHSDTTTHHQHHPHQPQPQRHHQPKQAHQKHHHHVGRSHARLPSSKGLHKQHGHGPPGSKLTRRITSPAAESTTAATGLAAAFPRPSGAHSHRRATSEVKLPRSSSGTHLPSNNSLPQAPQAGPIKRNRSHVEIGKRTKSAEKLKRTSSGTAIARGKNHLAGVRSTVHFDLGDGGDGDDDQDNDEWVDASGSNSPYLSRKGSLISSGQSSALAASRPQTPNEHEPAQSESSDAELAQQRPSTPERERLNHRQYLTSRLLQRAPSHGAPPQMTADMAKGSPAQLSPASTDRDSSVPPGSGGNDELTSRFVAAAGSGVTSEGSFYHHARSASRRSDDAPRRPRSMVDLQPPDPAETPALIEPDNSALVPRPGRRAAAPPAETSRIQQKLNLQRASSGIEPGQEVNGAAGVVVGGAPRAAALIGVGGPGFDGGSSRDPRVGRLLERTGMEYLVVRRYQNPVARSLRRLHHLPGSDKGRRIPRFGAATSAAAANGKRSLDLPVRHARNVSMPEAQRRPTTPRPGGLATAGRAGTSFNGDADGRLEERLSGSSLVGGADEDGTAALLRNLWEKPMDLSASTD